MIRLAELTHGEVRDHREVIFPTGSFEQHGLHMPLGTDTIIANAICEEVSSRKHIPVCPALPYGFSPEHSGFPGTINIGLGAFVAVVSSVVESLSRSFGRVYVVNFHGGNSSALEAAIRELSLSNVTLIHFWRAARAAMEEMKEQESIGIEHAGEFETSLMMAIRPDLVRSGDRGPASSIALKGERTWGNAWFSHELTPTGAFGGGGLASEEKGKAFLEECVGRLSEIIDEIREEA